VHFVDEDDLARDVVDEGFVRTSRGSGFQDGLHERVGEAFCPGLFGHAVEFLEEVPRGAFGVCGCFGECVD
jgi:hypothetical protein